MLQSLMVFWLASAKWDRNTVQSLHSIFWADVSLLCPRIWAATCLAMLVWGWSWLQPDPRRALWLRLFQGDKGWCGASSLSATVCVLHPPLSPTACVVVRLCSLQHHSGTCAKWMSVFLFACCWFLFACFVFYPLFGAVSVVLHEFPLACMHKKQILFRPGYMAERYIPGKFYPSLQRENNCEVDEGKYGIDLVYYLK